MTYEFNNYKLAKWSRIVRVRDSNICRECLNVCPLGYAHVHHIFPKHEYPEVAYILSNGVCLCSKCHIRVIHSDDKNVSRMRSLFWNQLQKRSVRLFNTKWQYKLLDMQDMPTENKLISMNISPGWRDMFIKCMLPAPT